VRTVVSTRPTARTSRTARLPLTDEGAVTRTARTARWATTVTAAAVGLVLTAGPALAARNPLAPQEGAETQADVSVAQALLLFAVVPLVLMLLISAVVWLPGAVRSGRYRPQRGWTAAPVWFAGPADPVAAVEAATVGTSARGGASGDW
jgi:hypothetical protein